MPADHKTRVFWPIAFLLLLVDCSSKELVVEKLGLSNVPHDIVGDAIRFTLSFNPDAAMGLSLGAFSRVGFAAAAILAIAVLAPLYRKTRATQTSRIVALALICGGAAGNMLDRLRSSRGVVDFIDIGIGSHRFYIFNVADMGVSVGAVMLAYLLWRADHAEPEQSHQRITK
ncbi:MAG: signal peptidase II [Gemmatimonadaceae bacterium]|nr:signal peptidase II [Gemmatimonadaceae bacterium]